MSKTVDIGDYKSAPKTPKEILTPRHKDWKKFIEKLHGERGCQVNRNNPEKVFRWRCNSDYTFTNRIFETMDNIDIENTIDFLQRHGGFCDCEILLNVEDSFERIEGAFTRRERNIMKQKITRTKEDLLEICLKVLHKSIYNFDIDVRKVDDSTYVFVEGDLFTLSFDEENEIGISFNKETLPIGAANITKELVINLSEYDLQNNIVIYEMFYFEINKDGEEEMRWVCNEEK